MSCVIICALCVCFCLVERKFRKMRTGIDDNYRAAPYDNESDEVLPTRDRKNAGSMDAGDDMSNMTPVGSIPDH